MDTTAFIDSANAHCEKNGAKLTDLRRQILDLVLQHEGVVKAYQILGDLQQTRASAAPPTVYRALDFLLEQGLVHRIASLNAFIGCNHPGEVHQGQFLICRQCHAAVELEHSAIDAAVQASANNLGFIVESQTVEVLGLCAQCRGTA